MWSTWGSLTEGSGSARTSVVSSVDGSSISDGNFAHFMTLASGGSVSGASMSGKIGWWWWRRVWWWWGMVYW